MPTAPVEEEEQEAQPHGPRSQEAEDLGSRLARLVVHRFDHGRARHVRQQVALPPEQQADDGADRCRHECRELPALPLRERKQRDGRERPAEVAGEAVHRERMAEARLRHASIEQREIRGVEHRVARAGNRRSEHERCVVWREPERNARQREGAHAEEQHRARADPVDDEARHGLPGTADHEEHRHQEADLGVAETEVPHQEREQWRDQQVEEMRSAVRQRHQADDLAIVTQTLRADVLRRGVHAPPSYRVAPP